MPWMVYFQQSAIVARRQGLGDLEEMGALVHSITCLPKGHFINISLFLHINGYTTLNPVLYHMHAVCCCVCARLGFALNKTSRLKAQMSQALAWHLNGISRYGVATGVAAGGLRSQSQLDEANPSERFVAFPFLGEERTGTLLGSFLTQLIMIGAPGRLECLDVCGLLVPRHRLFRLAPGQAGDPCGSPLREP